jgi:hypothetical protein
MGQTVADVPSELSLTPLQGGGGKYTIMQILVTQNHSTPPLYANRL